ncbi:major facilitator superfamily transporter [Paucilactobacillus hokkaidonensis JCM 18461]|uniref:Major facilitator superfamily transporter n=2 Tax=Paucilactobacillus hokkaidonensis TaxID=1193095 RepID=A0A0A1GR26_9LACO|nr:MFS transporter [Paucilactobacillus hokkaidonensis]KRO09854.1 arabinose efflux permease [Paucilactobacillus hokkaidonensis]BAP84742.1 major facilitator superfamily transporter [Paucilactobacillus hokkaidonensis JCM 18461]
MKKYRLQAIVMVLVAFMLGCNEFIVVGILSDLAKQFNVPLATVGYLVTIFATVYAISTPVITIYTSRFNRYKTLLALMLVFLIGNTFTGFATNYVMLIISRIITAVVAGSIISLIMTFASTIAPREKRAGLVSWIFAGFSIASVFGVPLGTAISTSYGWRYTFFIISVISIITFFLLVWLLPKKVDQVQGSIGKQLTLLKDRRIYLGIALVLFTAATMYSYYTYIRPLLTTALGFSTASLNWLLFLIGIMSIISNRLSGMLADNNGLKKMPYFYVADIVLLVLLPISLNTKVTGMIVLLALTLIVTILNSPIQIHFLNVAESDYPQSLVLASSLNSIFFNFGISLGSATASAMVGLVGLSKIGLGAAAYAAISLVLSIMLYAAIKQHRRVAVKKSSDL